MNTIKNKTNTYKIINENELNFESTLEDMRNENVIYSGEHYALSNWEIQFEINVTNENGEDRNFTIAFQEEERNEGLKNYSGYDVWLANYEADESEDLKEFLNHSDLSDEIIDYLMSIAIKKAKLTYSNLLKELNIIKLKNKG